MHPLLPWPFADGRFPDDLGAVVMQSVLDGRRPALQVVHFEDGYWGVADGVEAPSDRNAIATHLHHVLDRDPSLGGLATMPPDHQADRDAVGQPWTITPHDHRPNPGRWDRLRLAVDVLRLGEDEAVRRFEDRFGPGPRKAP